MIQSVRKRLSYGNVMATIAVFLVLGGGAAVAAGLKKNSVTTKAIKNGAVTTAKLKKDAVTGAKANESTFGIVPLAANATKAGSADKALQADSATKAETAVKAESAAKATDSELFAGRKVSEVRSGATGASTDVNVNLADAGATVLSHPVAILAESDLIANAGVRITNNGAAQAFTECRLENEGNGSFEAMSQSGGQTVPPGHTITMALTGFVNDLPAKGLGDPETVRIVCNESVGGNFAFESGDLTVTRVPVG